ncbi:DEAD/DEAH box helicase family protein [Tengunoibacter tsumagoiensis]|uniref:Helicase ATP-binding domain-containing protein n=1 Tax=Tengunoibacter tsumagoiensis TaxID=2014871 RepID=A0A402A052_9CHLR|nr:DEAD/DEAH box helicase family protein [Tengunoibacter tsumagoiensis]GCE12483.1 hypothetical protein KTT_23420 [Tengunoibacter tsumagoiensis]
MLNSPIPPDIDVTTHLQNVIAGWKGDRLGYQLDRLYQDCLDVVGKDKQLLPLRIMAVKAMDSTQLRQVLRSRSYQIQYGVDPIGRFDAILIPYRVSGIYGFLFAYEEELSVRDQVALFAHAVGHLLHNHSQRLVDNAPSLDPEADEAHTDRLAELRYLDSEQNRNYVDRVILNEFPLLTSLIEVADESPIIQNRAIRQLEPLLRASGWAEDYIKTPYIYTAGRIIPHSQQRGKSLKIDALLRGERLSLPLAAVHFQRDNESILEAERRLRQAARQLCVPFAYLVLQSQSQTVEITEMDWTSGDLVLSQLSYFPEREALVRRWLASQKITDVAARDALAYPYYADPPLRYYQETAVTRAVVATLQAQRGLRERKILLTLATGTGKTRVAFQILWKLKKSFQVKNVLFLADRGYLLDQAQTQTFWPFGDAIKRGLGERDTAHDVLFGTYQWIANPQDEEKRYQTYPPDYFDVIVVDECHRGSAAENSSWRKVLEHFSGAVQIGLTATPLSTKDVQTSHYFGPSLYTYSLSQGINDGYLAPYNVRLIQIGKEEPSTQKRLPQETQETVDEEIVMKTGKVMRQYTQVIAEHLAAYLQRQEHPRDHKTIVFCVNNEHADEMRQRLIEACAGWSRAGDIVRIVNDDGAEGKRDLDAFCSIEKRQPVIVTTSQLLSTGIDVPTCRTIVFARGVGSMVEFKQIIGRGTRLVEETKRWFTILDYAGAIKHFFDPDFDGEPTSIQTEEIDVDAAPAASVDEEPSEQPGEESTPAAGATEVQQEPTPHTEPLPDEQTAAALFGGQIPQATSPGAVSDGKEDYVADTQGGSEKPLLMSGTDKPEAPVEGAQASATTTATFQNSGTESEQEEPVTVCQASCSTTASTASTEPARPVAIAQPVAQADGESVRKARQQTAQEPEPVSHVIQGANGHRFKVVGEKWYELDASGRQLREGTKREFVAQSLRDLVKSPQELYSYWVNGEERKLLIDQLKEDVVGLDTLAAEMNLPEVDYYDLLRHVLFDLPLLTRPERVEQLRSRHPAFIERFAASPLALFVLEGLLEIYSTRPDVNFDSGWLEFVQITPKRTKQELMQEIKRANGGKAYLQTMEELQKLLYEDDQVSIDQ